MTTQGNPIAPTVTGGSLHLRQLEFFPTGTSLPSPWLRYSIVDIFAQSHRFVYHPQASLQYLALLMRRPLVNLQRVAPGLAAVSEEVMV